MQEERDCFSRFIETVSEAELEATTLYPHRRVLKAEEARTLHESLFVAWKARGYYYPLKERERDDLEAFQSEWFAREVDLEELRKRFVLHGIKHIIELKEYGPEYETDISLWEPHYDGAEGFWTSQEFEWLVYASHESSVTFGGWALSELKSIWPAWEKRIWNSPFHEPPTE